MVKTREKGLVQNRSAYVVVGVDLEGQKDVLGIWLYPTEGAKLWMSIMKELKQRGLDDILIICADGLTGLEEAVNAVYPQAVFQTCIVHLIRSSTRFVSYQDRKRLCADLRDVYTAADSESALEALTDFEEKWGKQYPTVAKAWHDRWAQVVPFLEFPQEVRRIIYTTNTIESLNRILRKTLKTKGALPNDEAALKLMYLSIQRAKKTWGRSTRHWGQALQQLAIMFGDRLPDS